MSSKLKAGTASSGAVLDADTTGILELQTGSTPTTAVTIDGSQNVGIGTASPAYPLDVVQKTSDDTYAFQLRGYTTGADGTRTVNMRTVSSNNGDWANFRMDASSFIWRYQGSTERMRIDSSGKVLIGTTSSYSSIVQGIQAQAAGSASLALSRTADNGAVARFFSTSTEVGNISVTGSTTSYNITSDYRLKENVAPMTNALVTVSALKPVTYNWKVDGSDGQGFIAHELQAVVPDAVTGEKDAVDAEGNPEYQSIDTSFLVATLTAAIQEQQAMITQLQADVATLKGIA